MSISLANGSAQTVSGATLTPKAPSPGAYAYSIDDPGNAVMQNIAGALDQPNTIRYAVSAISDIFKASAVNPATGQRTDGVNVLVQINEVWKYTDSTTGAVEVLPLSGHMVLKVPISPNINKVDLGDFVERLLGAVVRGDDGTIDDGLITLVHGVTRIPDVVVEDNPDLPPDP